MNIEKNFCATSTEQEDLYSAGKCPFILTENDTNRKKLPSDPNLLDEVTCGPYIKQKRFAVWRMY